MTKEELLSRTKRFAHDCVKLSVTLPNSYLSNHLKGQIIRSSTSVAANYRAACLAQSSPAFISKISIVIEEADETEFWLDFIRDEGLIKTDKVDLLQKEAHELASIFIASRRTAQKNL